MKIGGDYKADRMKLSLGEETLDKGQKTIAEYDIKEGAIFQLEFMEKPIKEPRMTGSGSTSHKERKPKSDKDKLFVIIKLKDEV